MNYIKRILCVTLLLCCGCSIHHYQHRSVTITAVYMHQVREYSVTYVDAKKTLQYFYFSNWPDSRATIIADVLPSDQMYVEFDEDQNRCYTNVVIHIHNVTEINGAGWHRGKGGHGQTNVIEAQP